MTNHRFRQDQLPNFAWFKKSLNACKPGGKSIQQLLISSRTKIPDISNDQLQIKNQQEVFKSVYKTKFALGRPKN